MNTAPSYSLPQTKFSIILVGEKQALCCQNLLVIIPRSQNWPPVISSPASFSYFPCWWARPPTTQSQAKSSTSFLILLGPHILSTASSCWFLIISACGVHTLPSLWLPSLLLSLHPPSLSVDCSCLVLTCLPAPLCSFPFLALKLREGVFASVYPSPLPSLVKTFHRLPIAHTQLDSTQALCIDTYL